MSLIYQDKEIANTGINDSQKSKTSTYSSQKIEELTAQAGGGVTYYIKGSEESESGYTNLLDADDNLVTWNQYLANRDNCSVMLLDDFYVNIPTFEGLRLTPTNIYSDEFNAVISTENSILEDKSPRLITAILYTPDDWDNDPIEVGITKEVLGGGGSGDDKLKELISTNLDRGYLGGGIIHPNLYEYDDEYLYRDVNFSYHYGQLELSSEKTSTTQSINTYIYKSIRLQAGVEYRFMGCAEGGSDSTYMLRLTDASIYHDITDYQGTTFVASGSSVSISIIIKTGVDVNGLVFMPQIVEEKYYFEGASFPQSWSNSVLTEAVMQLQHKKPINVFLSLDDNNEYKKIEDLNGNPVPFSVFESNEPVNIYLSPDFSIDTDAGHLYFKPCTLYRTSLGDYNYHGFAMCDDSTIYYNYNHDTIANVFCALWKDSSNNAYVSEFQYSLSKGAEYILTLGDRIDGYKYKLKSMITNTDVDFDLDSNEHNYKLWCGYINFGDFDAYDFYLEPRHGQTGAETEFETIYHYTDDNDVNRLFLINGVFDSTDYSVTFSYIELETKPKTFYIKPLDFTGGNVTKSRVAIYSDMTCTTLTTWADFTKNDAPYNKQNIKLVMFDNTNIKILDTFELSGSISSDYYTFEKVGSKDTIGASGSTFSAGYVKLQAYKYNNNAVFDATFTELQQVHKTLQLEMEDDGNHIYRYVNGQKTADFKKFSTFMMNSEYDILCIRYPYHFGKLYGGYNNDYNYFVFSGILKNDFDDKLYAVMVTFSDDGSNGIVTNFEAKALV